MSAYVVSDCQIKNREDLVRALEEVFGTGTVEVHDSPFNLMAYAGDKREDVANVVVRRRHVGGASNDVGFLQAEDGGWKAIVSKYDQGYLKKKLGGEFVTQIKTLAAVNAAERVAHSRGMKTTRVREGNKVKLTLKR